MIPDHVWHPWKFKCVPMNFWSDIRSHRFYFEWLCEEMGMTHPNCCYSMSYKVFCDNHGKGLIDRYYRNSPVQVVMGLNPEVKWQVWRFRGMRDGGVWRWIGEKVGVDWRKLKDLGKKVWEMEGERLLAFVKERFLKREEGNMDLNETRMRDILDELFPMHGRAHLREYME